MSTQAAGSLWRFAARAALAALLAWPAAGHAGAAPAADPCAPSASPTPARPDAPVRRLFLVRHGEADYLGADGKPRADTDAAELTARGREQARAAGRWLCEMGVTGFDLVVTSPLVRARQSTDELLSAMHLAPTVARPVAALREQDPDTETVAEARARILPALEHLRGESWRTALVVAHSQVDRIVLSDALIGSDALLERLGQGNGCINVLEFGEAGRPPVVRALNVCPPGGGHRY